MSVGDLDLSQRHTFVGASEVPAILGWCKYQSAASVWRSKVDPQPAEPPNAWQRRGHEDEEWMADAYARHTGRALGHWGTVRHPRHAFIAATPDRCIFGERRILECKGIYSVRRAAGWGRDGTDEIPRYVRAQVEVQMAVCGVEVCDVVASLPSADGRRRLGLFEVHRDAELSALILEEVVFFWERYVLTRQPPPRARKAA